MINASDFEILSSGLKLGLAEIRSLSTNASIFLQAQLFGLVAETSEKEFLHSVFSGTQETLLEIRAISCLNTLSSRLYNFGSIEWSLIISFLAKSFAELSISLE